MRVSVVIPALLVERHLPQLLSDIQRQSLRPEEVIVVDAGSRDASVRIAKQSPVAVVLHGEPPIARGRNLGGYSAKGELSWPLAHSRHADVAWGKGSGLYSPECVEVEFSEGRGGVGVVTSCSSVERGRTR